MEVVARTFQFNQNIGNTRLASVNDLSLVPVNYKTAHAYPPPPPSKPLGI